MDPVERCDSPTCDGLGTHTNPEHKGAYCVECIKDDHGYKVHCSGCERPIHYGSTIYGWYKVALCEECFVARCKI